RAAAQEGLYGARVLRQDVQRDIEEVRLQLGKFLRQLGGGHDFEYRVQRGDLRTAARNGDEPARLHLGWLRPLYRQGADELAPGLLERTLGQHQPGAEHDVHALAAVGR